MSVSREAFEQRDRDDPLAGRRDLFVLPDGVIYLDGNSLGALVRTVPERMRSAVEDEWGSGLIRSWNDADWYTAPQRVGAQLAALVGADADEVIVCDSTSVNLFKVLVAAARLEPTRRTIVTDETTFPTDAYITTEAAGLTGTVVSSVAPDEVVAAMEAAGEDLLAVSLTDVDYRTARRHDMRAITQRAHELGGLAVWDLCHSAGVLPVDLDGCGADLAVGCTYKYLNGGPGSPAFVFVAARHLDAIQQPLPGWHGHARPFALEPAYEPAPGIVRMLSGTAPQLGLLALEAALTAYDDVALDDVRAKSVALTEAFIELADERLAAHGFTVASPRRSAERGSHVALGHDHAYGITQALIARGVIGDFREPNLVRLGFAPLYVRHVDVWDAVELLVDVMEREEWSDAAHQQRNAVT